jgi:SOS-response transcriptional repressor LexA
MSAHKQACDEIIRFLEALQGPSPGLPDVVVGHWRKAIETCNEDMPDWGQAEGYCNSVVGVLNRLRASGGDFSQIDGAYGQVSILLGAIHLGQRDWTKARYHFGQGARRLRERNHKALESLAYYGWALTYKQERNWPSALESAQKALNIIRDLPMADRSTHTKSFEKRIEREIDAMTEDSLKDTSTSASIPIPIPILGNIAAGLGVIPAENIEDYLYLDEDHCNDADFAVRVEGDSMRDAGILHRDIALIRQQPLVKMKEIAAIVINTPAGSEGVLKRYHYYERRAELRHWYLESTNPASEHLVVIPRGANVPAIQALYAGKIRNLKYYMDAELIIAGKYVGLVREG